MLAAKKIVLLVDDEEDLVLTVKFQLEASKKYVVVTAGDGEEALGKLKQIRPDMIILDINMPKMGGIEFFKSICDADSKARYPVIVLTARANLEDLFKKLDVSGFMTKPFRIDELAAEIEIVLSIKDRETAAAQHEGKVAKKVIVIENDREVFDRMAVALLNEGYIVGYAPTSMDGVEKMLGNPPDAALIKLGMEDIPGYILISKLKNIAKTRDVKFVLYTPASDRLNIAVMEKICRDIGIKNFVASDYPDELIEELKKAGV